MEFCPGSKAFNQPVPEEFPCPRCGTEVEIWTDERKAACPGCGFIVRKKAETTCLAWCKYGEECVGKEAYSEYKANQLSTFKMKLLEELEAFFGDDRKRINHAKEVLGFAEELMIPVQADPFIVIPASILHDVGIKIAEEKYNSTAGHYQEQEGPPIARKILFRLGFTLKDIDEICAIIGSHHSPGEIETTNFQVLYEADWLVNLGDDFKDLPPEKKIRLIEKNFKTEKGKELALAMYGKD
jgi:DNA-directed RNA polymerase subunit RPC12/RpoP